MQNYSLEQFDSNFLPGYNNAGEAVIYRILPNWNPDFRKALKAKIELIKEKFLKSSKSGRRWF
jgi:hypothetical protein